MQTATSDEDHMVLHAAEFWCGNNAGDYIPYSPWFPVDFAPAYPGLYQVKDGEAIKFAWWHPAQYIPINYKQKAFVCGAWSEPRWSEIDARALAQTRTARVYSFRGLGYNPEAVTRTL